MYQKILVPFYMKMLLIAFISKIQTFRVDRILIFFCIFDKSGSFAADFGVLSKKMSSKNFQWKIFITSLFTDLYICLVCPLGEQLFSQCPIFDEKCQKMLTMTFFTPSSAIKTDFCDQEKRFGGFIANFRGTFETKKKIVFFFHLFFAF